MLTVVESQNVFDKLLASIIPKASASNGCVKKIGNKTYEIEGKAFKATAEEATKISEYINNGGRLDVDHFIKIRATSNIDANQYINIKERVEDHIMKGEFPEGLYKFSGLHDYDNFMNVTNSNKIHPDYEWQWKVDTDSGKVLNNPEGISVVEYRKVGATGWKEKTLAPKGTTAEEFMDAGFVLRDDYLGGKTTPPDPIDNTIKSTTKFQDTEYIIQGYSGIATSIENSSWWFTLPD